MDKLSQTRKRAFSNTESAVNPRLCPRYAKKSAQRKSYYIGVRFVSIKLLRFFLFSNVKQSYVAHKSVFTRLCMGIERVSLHMDTYACVSSVNT